MTTIIEPLLTEKEAAKILNVSPKALQHWRWAGGGPEFIKLGRLVRYERSALVAYIEKNRKFNTCYNSNNGGRNANY